MSRHAIFLYSCLLFIKDEINITSKSKDERKMKMKGTNNKTGAIKLLSVLSRNYYRNYFALAAGLISSNSISKTKVELAGILGRFAWS
ncbi:hypothetical protein SAMN05421784_1569 [Xenorhabdus koppenhoeferi]|uniref:Uncharacterized protein n=1 Tax=Xenorhabdus koppenhoeferi TaxID=351659 RepID=A0A1I7KE39_9GAMM|nr:hypothetical protein SAMN05421784_1569 [Xenorhabdus koppenhoeferi]